MLIAYAKVGKTTFGQALGASVGMGHAFLDFETTAARVLVIAAEDPEEYTAYTARHLQVDRHRDDVLSAQPHPQSARASRSIVGTMPQGQLRLRARRLLAGAHPWTGAAMRTDNAGMVRVVEDVKAAARASGVPWFFHAHSGKGEDQDDDADPSQAHAAAPLRRPAAATTRCGCGMPMAPSARSGASAAKAASSPCRRRPSTTTPPMRAPTPCHRRHEAGHHRHDLAADLRGRRVDRGPDWAPRKIARRIRRARPAGPHDREPASAHLDGPEWPARGRDCRGTAPRPKNQTLSAAHMTVTVPCSMSGTVGNSAFLLRRPSHVPIYRDRSQQSLYRNSGNSGTVGFTAGASAMGFTVPPSREEQWEQWGSDGADAPSVAAPSAVAWWSVAAPAGSPGCRRSPVPRIRGERLQQLRLNLWRADPRCQQCRRVVRCCQSASAITS